ESRFGFEPEITAKVARMRCRIYEVGISYDGRSYSEGKKIGWKDAVRALFCLLKYGLFRRAAGRPPSGPGSGTGPGSGLGVTAPDVVPGQVEREKAGEEVQ